MNEVKNWFQMMQTGVYKVMVDRTALYTPEAVDLYQQSILLSNEGTLVPVKDEIVLSAITILGMIDIDKRGYSFSLVNNAMAKEIVEILYNHISACIEIKNRNPLGEYPVPFDDLVSMEIFMLKVLKSNPKLLVDEFTACLEQRLQSSSMISMFDAPSKAVAKDNPEDVFRRVTTSNTSGHFGALGINIDDILNDDN